jgi:hypothetical protein
MGQACAYTFELGAFSISCRDSLCVCPKTILATSEISLCFVELGAS